MIHFDSNEEKYFSWYLEELKERKYIDNWKKIEIAYELTDGLSHTYIKKMKKIEDVELMQTILSPSSYTPDFKIFWNKKAYGIFVQDINNTKNKIVTPFICDSEGISIVETKGTFDMGNMTRLATLNIKFMYFRYNIYVNLIKVPTIFKKTFTPDRYLMTDKTFRPRAINYGTKKKPIGPKSLSKFINEIC